MFFLVTFIYLQILWFYFSVQLNNISSCVCITFLLSICWLFPLSKNFLRTFRLFPSSKNYEYSSKKHGWASVCHVLWVYANEWHIPGHMVDLFLDFWELFILISIVTAMVYLTDLSILACSTRYWLLVFAILIEVR